MHHNKARDTKQLGLILSNVRKTGKLTQSALALEAGILQKTVSAVERGEGGSSLETLFRILAALDLEIRIEKRGR